MKNNMLIQKRLVAIWFSIITVRVAPGSAPDTAPGPAFQLIEVPGFFKDRFCKVCQAVNLQALPESSILRPMPNVDKNLLSNPLLITREYMSKGGGCFTDKTWAGGVGTWKWGRLVKNPEPLPTHLPPERKDWLLEHLTPEKRNDPNFVEEYLRRKIDSYQKSKIKVVTGSIRINACLAPHSQGAYQYLISLKSVSSLPIQSVISGFSESNHIEGLGTIALYEQWAGFSHIMFVRDNIAVSIDARGELADEALPLATKIDALIQEQPALSYNQLLARRPSITIAPKAEKTLAEGQWAVSFDTSAPAGQEIVDVRSYVDGQLSGIEDHRVVITNKKNGQSVRVKVITTTNELLTNAIERQVTIPE